MTYGDFKVNFIEVFDENYSKERVITLAATLEQHSEHPIAKGIIEKFNAMELTYLESQDFQAIKGKGIEGTIEGHQVMVVSPGYLEENNLTLPKRAS